jgi:hypothetical protein
MNACNVSKLRQDNSCQYLKLWEEIWENNLENSVCWLGPPLWSSFQSSWLQIQKSGFDSRRYQIFWEAVGLERGSLSLVGTIEELLERKSSGSGIEKREYGLREPST